MDFSRCQCQTWGFCPLYNRIMEKDPPNWQWCQNTSQIEREKYYSILIRSPPENDSVYKITRVQDLYTKTEKILEYIQDNHINGIVGVPRSGMIPASYLSVLSSLPLYSINNQDIVKLNFSSENGGFRMGYFSGESDNLLFVDDTCHGGVAARQLRDLFGDTIKIAVTFSTSRGLEYIDFASSILEPPHFLEWNFYNCSLSTSAIFDIDGIFCPNVPIEVAIDEEKYIEWITNVKPYLHTIPKLFKASKIVTGRLEKYRDITENWLRKHNFNYKELIMFPTERQKERDSDHFFVVGNYKGEIFAKSDDNFFIESELSEANIIRKHTNKVVLCPNI